MASKATCMPALLWNKVQYDAIFRHRNEVLAHLVLVLLTKIVNHIHQQLTLNRRFASVMLNAQHLQNVCELITMQAYYTYSVDSQSSHRCTVNEQFALNDI